MIKYFIRHYWRYLAMALAFATMSFLLGSCKVNAEERIQSIPFGYAQESNSTNINIYNSNNANFANWGRGYLTFSIVQYKAGVGTSFTMSTINGIKVTSSGNIYVCQYGSVQNNFSYDNDNMKAVAYSVICDVTMGEDGLQRIDIEMMNGSNATLSNSIVTRTSDYMTFSDNLEVDISSVISTQTTLMQQYMNTIIQNQATYTQSINTTITNIVNSNFATLNSIMNNGIDAINGRLDQIIANNQVCNYIDKSNIETDNKALITNGIIGNNFNNYGITDYIKISKNAKIKILTNFQVSASTSEMCFYNINKVVISCKLNNTLSINQLITIPNNASYVRFSINKVNNEPQIEICDTAQNITNQQNEQIINSQKETNDTLKDSSVDDPDSDLEDMQENEISNSVISDLLLLPINMFENIIDAIGGTCSSFPLGELLGTSLVLPCINIPSLIGNNLWNVIDILFCGIFVLSIRKKFVDIFENITSLKDRGNELE